MNRPLTDRRRFLQAAAGAAAGAALGCRGVPTIFGYQAGARALYDPNINSVHVPVFHNRAFQTTPFRGIEVEITQAVVREIGAKTPFKVLSDPDRADTELLGNVVNISKTLLNRNQQNTLREGEVVLTVDVLWRDLRDGRVLSTPRRGGPPPGEVIPPFDPDVPVPPPPCEPIVALPVRLVATGRLIPELGESSASGEKRAVDLLATQVVSMMEKPW